jgi:dATP pyrophosphohydrolase
VVATDYKRPESVLVVVYTRAGEVLLLQRTQPEDFWQSVTGSLLRDETPAQTAIRELEEETGLPADGLVDCNITNHFPIHPAWRQRYAPEVVENVEHVFCLPVDERPPIRLNPAEHSQLVWLPRQQACAKVSSWTNRDAILACVPAISTGIGDTGSKQR